MFHRGYSHTKIYFTDNKNFADANFAKMWLGAENPAKKFSVPWDVLSCFYNFFLYVLYLIFKKVAVNFFNTYLKKKSQVLKRPLKFFSEKNLFLPCLLVTLKKN